MILPGSTIGVVGGGQLGRMLGLAARNMGYHFITLEPSIDCPAASISDQTFVSNYNNEKILQQLAEKADVLTFEFENIPSSAFDEISQNLPIHPSSSVLHICQNREREKRFLSSNNYPLPQFRIINDLKELRLAVQALGTPCVIKTADFGYDGKGQIKLESDTDLADAWHKLNVPLAILESWVTYECEISIICARSSSGEIATFPLAENIHTNHILDLSIVPARVPEPVIQTAKEIAMSLAED
ncbi:MAG: ATP-grasp domain-containing protein, partial [Verrucomicrobiota bacterium]